MLFRAKNSTLLLTLNGLSSYFRKFQFFRAFYIPSFFCYNDVHVCPITFNVGKDQLLSKKRQAHIHIFLNKINASLIPRYFFPSFFSSLRLYRLPLSKPHMSPPRNISTVLKIFRSLQFSYKKF